MAGEIAGWAYDKQGTVLKQGKLISGLITNEAAAKILLSRNS
ncbi:MAG: hypothetical protein AAFQ74_10820 [Cyanobacteria bacterium J06623_4]